MIQKMFHYYTREMVAKRRQLISIKVKLELLFRICALYLMIHLLVQEKLKLKV